jgi:hypothetical protein
VIGGELSSNSEDGPLMFRTVDDECRRNR